MAGAHASTGNVNFVGTVYKNQTRLRAWRKRSRKRLILDQGCR